MSEIRPRPIRQKSAPIRDEKYRRWLSDQPCCVCGATPCQAAHHGHSSMGMKGGDDLCVSLCPVHHRKYDTAPEGKEKWWMKNVEIPRVMRQYQLWLTRQT